jgi:transposase
MTDTARAQVLKHIRHKYACACCRQGVKIAPVPAHILPKSKAPPGLLAHVVTAKYVDALPLRPQEVQFARLRVDLPHATMVNCRHVTGPRFYRREAPHA